MSYNIDPKDPKPAEQTQPAPLPDRDDFPRYDPTEWVQKGDVDDYDTKGDIGRLDD